MRTEYIKREDAIKSLTGWETDPTDEEITHTLNSIPAEEVEPVKHGRWVHCNGKSNLWYCSECGEKIMYNPTRRTYNIEKKPVHEVNKRCRNCGAKMDGDNV